MTGLPPGPRTPVLAQTVLSAVRPLAFAESCRRKYGDLFTIKVFPVGTVVCAADPAVIRRAVTAESSTLLAGDANRVMDFVVGPRSVLLLDGPEHVRCRQVLLPPFRGPSVAAYQDTIAEITAEAVRDWPAGVPVRLMPRMQHLTLEIMMRVVFGITDLRRLAGLRALVPQLLHMNPAVVLFPLLRKDWGRWSPGGKFARVRDAVDEILFAEIARRRREDTDSTDVLSLLLRMRHADGQPATDEELRDNLITVLAVGHETTATTLSWAFERLVRHPESLARLESELDAGEYTYLDAVINETLRVRPVVGDIARILAAPATIGGYRLPAGIMLALSLGLLHSSPERYPEPAAFRPERFLDQPPGPELFLPFGGGPHRCLGAAFAMTTMRTVIATVLARTRPRAAAPGPERQRARGPVLAPARGAEVVLHRRTAFRTR
ncbi:MULTISPECIES: cytochrome P450 [unclassified Crossiella]|uniref:cytochrome P450 n=1 Tax=unclassified Crossiella TaxID=2620835 RepID=UPI001FFECBD0|nr:MULTISPECIES: cytochrome P450 [unclassified Crossiella]MCK2239283.1 cytochrome P450 [Crossiella sp. S99.2]MCK2251147.1 cytochrome P450 [Crossiella sp. S99.1]